ncbi:MULTISPECIES: SpoIIE family protein phosphatase [unclassified Streptomyces]|uniref:SpoIIE family protein phosphatase n=1 Tax=unclassified Streptomyces TaxID=2593676 RepID=UPI00380D7C91
MYRVTDQPPFVPPDQPQSYEAAQQLADAAVPAVADYAAVEVSDATVSERAAMSGLPATVLDFRRGAFRAVRPDVMLHAYEVGEVSELPPRTPYRASLVDLRPRIVLNLHSRTAWLLRDPVRARLMRGSRTHSVLVVPLDVGGVLLGLAAFYRTAGSPAFSQADLREAGRLGRRAALLLDHERRRLVHEAAARILQEALHESDAPAVSALDAVRGHVPESSAPGSWIDVVPLPSARVALVTGTAGGSGVTATAGMSQVRAAIRALLLLDMNPGEVIARLGRRAGAARTPVHCLLAVYDPVTRRCTTASGGDAGAEPAFPAEMSPPDRAGAEECAPLAAAPVAEFDVPSGSILLLSCGTDDGTGSAPVIRILPPTGDDPEDAVDTAVSVGLAAGAGGRSEPVLLAALIRTLDPADVATWEVPNDPAAVSAARAWADGQLTHWSLPELSFTTTLVVSELVTNAVRYSSGPIRLRLIRDRALICEVSDVCSSAPHPRQSTPSDQNGRGLSIVAHLTEAQGTRYTATGKTVWVEQNILPEAA